MIRSNAMPAVKTQADGRQVLDLTAEAVGKGTHQLQVDLSAVPAAGTLYVQGRTPGATGFVTLDGSFDLTDATTHMQQVTGFFDAFAFMPDSLTAGVGYRVTVVSGDL